MKTRLLVSALLTMFFMSFFMPTVSGQKLIAMVKPYGSDLWGYTNIKGEMVITSQFSKCFPFSKDGLAPIHDAKAKLYYFINLKGEKLGTEINDFKLIGVLGFDVKGFNDGLAAVCQNKKWGFLNSKGKVFIPLKYDDVTEFCDGSAVAKIGDKYYVLNTKGEEFNVEGSDIATVKEFSEGFAPYKSTGKLFGFIGKDGKVAINAQFESVGYFSDGVAWAKTMDGLLGYINTKGEWVIKPQFAAGKEFDNISGMARVKLGDKWAYVNKSGEVIYVNDSEAWGDFHEGLAEGKKNGQKGFFDNKGKWVIEPQFDEARNFKNGYASVKKGDKWGVINKEGKWIIQPTFSSIRDFESVVE
jgi:hypothetical protein